MTELIAVKNSSAANALSWAAEVLRGRFEKVLEHREAALDARDIEGVHQMRVAIRRLRSALRDFAPLLKKRPLKESKKDLKKLADTLGAARDEDVALAELEKLRRKAKNEKVKASVEKKIATRRVTRDATQAVLNETLEATAIENVREKFLKALDETVKAGGKAAELTPREAGREVISNGLREFCNLSDSLYDPFNREKLHELRIAAKRLRYAIELFTVCFGEAIAPFAEGISDMQTFLGELHDRDIWIDNLSRRLNKKKGKKQHGDFWLLSRFVKERTKNYRAALRLWDKWQKNNFIEKLLTVLIKETPEAERNPETPPPTPPPS
jgi:CHAD domain-containing protein